MKPSKTFPFVLYFGLYLNLSQCVAEEINEGDNFNSKRHQSMLAVSCFFQGICESIILYQVTASHQMVYIDGFSRCNTQRKCYDY